MLTEEILNIEEMRADFPILSGKVNGHALIYFDNAATSQTPKQVIETIVNYYEFHNANVHRGVHQISQEATDMIENARDIIKEHFNAEKREEIIFTKGTTEGINLIANGLSSILK